MMAATTSTDDRKFAVFSMESIQTYAESIGIAELPENVLQKLSEDTSYRVRELVSKSCEFMRHSRRKNMKFTDVKHAIQWSNIHPVLGSDTSLNFNSSENIYFLDDPLLDLKEVVSSESKLSRPYSIELSTLWLTNKDLHSSKQTKEKDMEECMDVDTSSAKSDDFTVCYNSIVECILSDNEILFEEVLKNLKLNPKIGPMVPYLVNFVTNSNLISHDLGKLSMMLFLIKALTDNKYVSLELYLKPLLSSVMYCVLEPLAASINPLNDHWLLRDYGSFLVALITCSYPNQTNALLDYVCSPLYDILSDPTRPLCSHYGAMMSIFMLGSDVIKNVLLPMLQKYVSTFLRPIVDDFSPTSTHMKEDAHKVLGAAVQCVEKLLHQDMSGEEIELYFLRNNISISELFGDAVTVRIPQYSNFRYKPSWTFSEHSNVPARTYDMVSQVVKRNNRPTTKWSAAQVFCVSKHLPCYGNVKINYCRSLPLKSRLNNSQPRTALKLSFPYHFVCKKNITRHKDQSRSVCSSLLSWI